MPQQSSADPFVIRSIEESDTAVTVEGDVDLVPLQAGIRECLPAAIRRAAPALFGLLQGRNVVTEVREVRFGANDDPHEVTASVTVNVRADVLGEIASVELNGRIAVAFVNASTMRARARLDQIRGDIRLPFLRGPTFTLPMDGLQVADRTFPITFPALIDQGTAVSSYAITAVSGQSAHVRLVLTDSLVPATPSPASVPCAANVQPQPGPNEACQGVVGCRPGLVCREQWEEVPGSVSESIVAQTGQRGIFSPENRSFPDGAACPADTRRVGAPRGDGSSDTTCEGSWASDDPQDCRVNVHWEHGPGRWHCVVRISYQPVQRRSLGMRCQSP